MGVRQNKVLFCDYCGISITGDEILQGCEYCHKHFCIYHAGAKLHNCSNYKEPEKEKEDVTEAFREYGRRVESERTMKTIFNILKIALIILVIYLIYLALTNTSETTTIVQNMSNLSNMSNNFSL